MEDTPAKSKLPLWIDLDNTPHVVFFEPIIEELRARGFPLIITARDAFQVCELADQKKIPYQRIGRHYGKNLFLKVTGLLYRALQLTPIALRERPVLSLSHGSRSQIFTCKALRIPSIIFCDYEHGKALPFMHPTWELVPEVIPAEAIFRKTDRVLKYPGIKEDVYAWKFRPDPTLPAGLGLSDSDLIATVRPPANEAHYHSAAGEELFVRFMELAVRQPHMRVVLLPRNKKQGELMRQRWPQWFANRKTVVPPALDGLNLIWHSDLLVSGGGTMNREAAALGVPAYSIFRGPIGAVDRHLHQTGRLVLIESAEDVDRQIRLEKRSRQTLPASRRTLDHIVNTIEGLIGKLRAKR